MKNGFRYILYIVIFIIVGIGITLLILKNESVQYLSENFGVAKLVVPLKVSPSTSKDTLDTELFKDTKFVSLRNNVIKFDFDSICKNAVGQVQTVSTSSDGTVSTSTRSLNCIVGNNIPFPVPPKTK